MEFMKGLSESEKKVIGTARKLSIKTMGYDCRKWRLETGTSLREMAENSGYSQKTLQAFEAGRLNNALIFAIYLYRGYKPTGREITGWSVEEQANSLWIEDEGFRNHYRESVGLNREGMEV